MRALLLLLVACVDPDTRNGECPMPVEGAVYDCTVEDNGVAFTQVLRCDEDSQLASRAVKVNFPSEGMTVSCAPTRIICLLESND